MADLNQTSRLLSEIEAKVKSLTSALKFMQNEYSGNARTQSYLKEYINYIDKVIVELNMLKNAQNTVDSSGADFGKFNKSVDNMREKINSAITNIEKLRDRLGSSAILPSSIPIVSSKDIQEVLADLDVKDVSKLDIVRNKILDVSMVVGQVSKTINSGINSVINIIRSGTNIIGKVITSGMAVVGVIKTGVTNIISLFGNLGNRVREFFSITSANNGIVTALGAINKAVTNVMNTFGQFKQLYMSIFENEAINQGKKLTSSITTLNTIIGKDATDATVAWANELERATGMSAKSLIADMQELTGVLYGLGMSTEDVGVGAQNLTVMSRYLATLGFAGGSVDEVVRKLTSGMKGMTASVDDLGLSVREAEMDSFLRDLKAQGGEFANIGTSFANLNEEARVYVRYASLIKQFTDNFDITKFTKSLNSTSGRLTLVSEAWASLVYTLGSALAKVGAALAGWVIPILNFLQSKIVQFMSWLGGIFGIDFDISLGSGLNSDNLDRISGSLGNVKDEIEAVDKAASDAASSGGGLQSFDRVNNIDTSSGSGSSSSGGSSDAFDYSSLMTSALDELNKKMEETTDNFLDDLREKNKKALKDMVNKWKEYWEGVTGRKFSFGFDFDKIKENLKATFNNLKVVAENLGKVLIGTLLKAFDDMNIGTIITNFTSLLKSFSNLAVVVSDVLGPAMDALYENGLKPIFTWIGEVVNGKINSLIDLFDNLADSVDNNRDSIINAFGDIGNKIGQVFRVLTGQKTLDDAVAMSDDSGWATFLNTLESIKYIIGEIGTYLGEKIKSDVLPWLVEKLKELGDWVTEHKEDIVTLIKTLADTAWDTFKLFVDLVGKLINFVVENPEAVKVFLEGLVAVKIASWASGAASSIGQLITNLTLLNGMKMLTGGGGLLGGLGGVASTGAAGAGAAGAGAAGAGAAGAGAAGGIALGPVLAVVAAIALVAGLFVNLYNTSENFRNTVNGVFEDIGKALGDAGEKIGEAFGRLGEAFNIAGQAYEDSGLKDIVEKVFTQLVKTFGKNFESTINLISGAIVFIIDTVASAIKTIVNFLGLIGSIFELIGALLSGDEEKIGNAIENIKNNFFGLVDTVFGYITNTFLPWLGTMISYIVDMVVNGFGDGISNGWESIKQKISEVFNNVINTIKDILGIHSPSTVMLDIGINIMQGLINGISSLANSLIEKAFNIGSNIKNAIVDGIGNIKNIVDDKIESVKNAGKNILDGLKSTGENIIGWVGTTFTGKTKASTASTITTHANGGSIAGGQLFIANEGGNAELIGNIDGSGKTNVANNQMITRAIYEAVYNAMAEVENQKSGNMNNQKTEINLNGFGLIDRSSLNNLARMLNPYINSSNTRTANTNFR